MAWPDGHTIVANWASRGNPPVEPRYHRSLPSTPDGLAGRPHHRDGVADTLNCGGNNGGFRTEPGALVAFTKSHNVSGDDDPETWEAGREARAMNGFDDDRTTLVLGGIADDPLLPLGLDSHRYRCCGNGVVSDVAEWIGRRLADYLGGVA